MKKENMRKLNLDEVKNIELEILSVIDKFCFENGIQYWLDFGTLIGAVRHQGFIPWDDDIDIGMLRQDFNKFMKLFCLSNNRYQFHAFEKDSFQYISGKCGEVWDTNTLLIHSRSKKQDCIKIDVFPYDNVPDDTIKVRKLMKKEQRLFRVIALQYHNHTPVGSIVRRVSVHILRCLTRILPDIFIKKITSLYSECNNTNTGRVLCFTPSAKPIEKSVLEDTIKVLFEGHEFKIPRRYDELLSLEYGKYMELPPIAERRPLHNYEEAYIIFNK